MPDTEVEPEAGLEAASAAVFPENPPLSVRERAYAAAALHPSCTLEIRRLKRKKLFEAIYHSKPGKPSFLFRAKAPTLDAALDAATGQFLGFARKTGLDVEKEAADAAAE